ncbi:MAG: NACHT domain-containing protein [Stenomitos frigidus ULC029]
MDREMKQSGDQQADRDIFNIDNKGTVTVINQPVPQRSRSESLLLQAVKQEVISRLDQSLHNAVFINLGKQSQPQQVKRPWDAEIKIGSRSPEPLPTETTILDVFDRPGIDGRLLILGEPGAGKTTTMLDLAKALCDRAEQDATAFIPVLLNLSSWKDPKQTMTAWLVEELKSKYGVRKDIGTKWLADKQLLPLLDGLDEVKPEHQESCVQAINRWLESDDRPPSLAVCCRREEYEKVVRGRWQKDVEETRDETRMHLNGAICLNELNDMQIENYLMQLQQQDLWKTLTKDSILLELMRNPFWLSILILSVEELDPKAWRRLRTSVERFQYLLDAYVRQMLKRQIQNKVYGESKVPTNKQTRLWLIYLANQMTNDSQTEFLIEAMQISWLSDKNLKQIYRFLRALLLNLTIAALSAAIICSVFWDYFGFWGMFIGIFFGVSSGMILKGEEEIETVEALRWSWREFINGFIKSFRSSASLIKFFMYFGKPPRCFYRWRFIKSLLRDIHILAWYFWAAFCLIFGSILTLIFSPFIGLVNGLTSGSALEEKNIPNQGIQMSMENFGNLGLIGALTGGLISGSVSWFISYSNQDLTRWLLGGVVMGIFIGFFIGLKRGGIACIQHFSLRLILFYSGSIPWNYARFLDYSTERLLLQRVGGRYRFIHKSLQEHFARMGE